MTKQETSQQDTNLPDSLTQGAIALRKQYGWLYDRVVGVLRQADVVGVYLLTGLEYEIEAQLIIPKLHQARNHEDVEPMVQEAFSHWFLQKGTLPQQERLRTWWAAYHIWQVWCEWKQEPKPTSLTRAGGLLNNNRQRDMSFKEENRWKA